MKGQTLTDICSGSGLSLKEISSANGLENPDRLKVGQKLLIPSSRDDILKVKEELARRKAESDAKLKTAPLVEMKTYEIRQGDSLWSIANAFDLDINTLFGCNTFKNPDVLKPGTTISVPNQDGIFYKVKKGDSLSSITKKYGVHVEGVYSANKMTEEDTLVAGQKLFLPAAKPLSVAHSRSVSGSSSARGFRWPVVGRISSPFGWRRDPFNKRKDFHTGMDIKAPSGRTIVASKGGKVVYSGWMGGYGRVIVIDHGGGYKTLYAHCSRLLVSRGRKVSQGQAIARVGSSGRSTGPHVHFEVRYRNSPINPLKVLR
jgi:murein DD-endopeptidase MepM/ murein hydrolase activator NlpD